MTAKHGDVATGPGWELRCGRWQDVLADVGQVDAVITDPPYSARTEVGFRSHKGCHYGVNDDPISYGSIVEADADALAEWTCQTAARWAVVFNDHIGWMWFEQAFKARGWYTFAPVIWCKRAAPPRFAGDGPTSSVEHILVARPRRKLDKEEIGSRPGHYLGMRAVRGACSNGAVLTGGKPADLMQAIVRDYSRPDDMVADPFSGGASTLLAALSEGRRAIGAEMDPETFAKAKRRLEAGYTPDLFAGVTP